VLDPFAGSNTTGAVAEALGRKWLAVEQDAEYARASKARFMAEAVRPAA
jgi:site-specific DNA-methyltransferase (cytosine-N4-specific)